jgi:hypothetical protein
MTTTTTTMTIERTDLLELLATRRHFLTFTARDLTDEQAASTPTASALSVGGLIKHVSRTEESWARFMQGDASALGGGKAWDDWDESDWAARVAEFRMEPGETLVGLLADYERVAQRTDDLVRTLPSLDVSYPLPAAPWFAPGAHRTVRQALLHIATETAQHAGHADIVRETIDGAKSMG